MEQPVEDHAPVGASAPVEPRDELIEVLTVVALAAGALVGAFDQALDLGEQPVDRGQGLMSRAVPEAETLND